MKRNNLSLLFLGLVLIAVGILWGGYSVGVWEFNIFFPGWWTLILIVMPIFGMIRHGVKAFDVIILAVGLFLLLTSLGIIDSLRIKLLFWPAVLVIIGLMLIFGIFRNRVPKGLEKEADAYVSGVFSTVRRHCDGKPYAGGRVKAFFGSASLDLRNSIIEQDIRIYANALCGEVTVLFPPNVSLVVEDSSFLGQVRDNVPVNHAYNVPTVKVVCHAVLGEIKLG